MPALENRHYTRHQWGEKVIIIAEDELALSKRLCGGPEVEAPSKEHHSSLSLGRSYPTL